MKKKVLEFEILFRRPFKRKLLRKPKNLGVGTFPDPVGNFGPPGGHFGIFRLCVVAGGERGGERLSC